MTKNTYERLSLAKEQLDTALDLFLDNKKFSSAITLAGAAEEIFGRALRLQKKQPLIDYWYQEMAELLTWRHRYVSEPERTRMFRDECNQARNALKHLQEDKGEIITIDLEDAACWMLVRALQNGKELGLKFNREGGFDNWFFENVVGP